MLSKLLFSNLLIILSFQISWSQADLSLIPYPNHVELQKGHLTLPRTIKINLPEGQDWDFVSLAISSQINRTQHFNAIVSDQNPVINYIQIKDQDLGEEGYTLSVSKKHIEVKSNTAKGAFYATQTLLQLFPQDIFSNNPLSGNKKWKIPQIYIKDHPQFSYRGLHLDVARHFFDVAFVKRYIDLMAMHKFNTFHWHLTDDQGWRIHIEKYPLLTEVGARRKQGNNPDMYEGFYTQEQIKEVVAYAKTKFVTIIPEIEMPGHATAAVSAYPELGYFNHSISIPNTWGIFNNNFNLKEETFSFLKDVLEEVIALFPSDYIHIGGDECRKNQWQSSEHVTQLMQDFQLKDYNEVQSYFIKRIDTFLVSKNKKLIGWDEILDGGLSPNATVMSWRGEEGALKAARLKHPSIMTPVSCCYLDYAQYSIEQEPVCYPRLIKLEQTYLYNPIPAGLDSSLHHYILGVQGNAWSEYLTSNHKVEYNIWPRAAAIAEVGWTNNHLKNYDSFLKRWNTHKLRLDHLNVNYFGAPINKNYDYNWGKATPTFDFLVN